MSATTHAPELGELGGRRVRGRPELYTSYRQDQALLNTAPKRAGVTALFLAGVVLPFLVGNDMVLLLATAAAAAIGAIGLNIVTGMAGQVSLGHAFFVGVGAFTAATLAGDPDSSRHIGFGLDMLLWLPGAAVVAGAFGALVSPLAVRLRGLYLAIVTLGLVFLGEHAFKELKDLTGGVGVGRPGPEAVVLGVDLTEPSTLLGLTLTRHVKLYLLMLVLLAVCAVLGRNVGRSALGRAFSAVRDRDIAAAVIGVPLTKYKVLAFTISSAFAGVSGALLYTIIGHIEPSSFNLLMSIRFIAMILIGGIATVSGAIMGAVFITMLPRMSQFLVRELPFLSGGQLLDQHQIEAVLYGLLIIGFLVFEPRGLFGVWLRVRNYWKGWPFSY
ncbi:MAG TPA: branched-chain amino acid ABC transporter permease [Egibacteraceae bacterium]|nr:branched-chain amino acid ABC transporter permease [Egibacteraceae bacterium]